MTTRAQLETDLDAWLSRDDVSAGSEINTIFRIAESHIATDVRPVVLETSTTLSATSRRTQLPTNFLEIRHVFIDANGFRIMEYKTPEAIRETSSWYSGRDGAYYTIEGDGTDRVEIVLADAPSVSSPASLDVLYHARLAALSAAGDSNWLSVNHYEIYLYALLFAAGEVLQEEELEARYYNKYKSRIDEFAKHENRKRYGSGPKVAYGSPRAVV